MALRLRDFMSCLSASWRSKLWLLPSRRATLVTAAALRPCTARPTWPCRQGRSRSRSCSGTGPKRPIPDSSCCLSLAGVPVTIWLCVVPGGCPLIARVGRGGVRLDRPLFVPRRWAVRLVSRPSLGASYPPPGSRFGYRTIWCALTGRTTIPVVGTSCCVLLLAASQRGNLRIFPGAGARCPHSLCAGLSPLFSLLCLPYIPSDGGVKPQVPPRSADSGLIRTAE